MQLITTMMLTISIMMVSTIYSLPYPGADSDEQELNITIYSNGTNSTHTLDPSDSSIKVALPVDSDSDSSADIIIDDFQQTDDNSTGVSSEDRLTIAIEVPKNKREVELLILPDDVVEDKDYDGMALAESVVFRPLFAYRKSYEQRSRNN